MTIAQLQSEIAHLERNIATIEQDLLQETKDEIKIANKITIVKKALEGNLSRPTFESKQGEIARHEKELRAIAVKKAGLDNRLAFKKKELTGRQQKLNQEEERESEKEG